MKPPSLLRVRVTQGVGLVAIAVGFSLLYAVCGLAWAIKTFGVPLEEEEKP